VPELVDRPQVDAGSIEGETVPVVEAGVFPEAMQEDHRGAWVGDSPVPVVDPAALMIEERHVLDCTRIGAGNQVAR